MIGTFLRNTILRRRGGVSPVLAACLVLLLGVQPVFAQNSRVTVSGTVTDVFGPVIGVGVVEKGNTTNGTVTDVDGNYALSVPANAVLVFSSIGYEPQEISVAGRTSIDVILHEDTEMLEDVVVVGFGTQKKVNLTGSVGVATSKDIEARPVSSAVQALQGLVPGLQISSNTGELGSGMNINIRGDGTIGDGSSGSPLVLVDGMESDLSLVNPQDIETVSVLKDAAASSIYGSRAPFGVILITTKKGKSGDAKINYNNNFRIGSPIRLQHVMDSYTFALYFDEGYKNANYGIRFDEPYLQRILDFQAAGGTISGGILPAANGRWDTAFEKTYANTDWYAELYKSHNFSQEHNVSASGGSDKVSYYASLGYLSQDGLLRYGSDLMDRFNVSAKFSAQLTDWMRLNYSMRFVRQDLNRPSRFDNGLYDRIARQTWPTLPIYDENGFFFKANADPPAVALSEGGVTTTQTDQTYHQASLVLEPVKNWVTNIEFNYRINNMNQRAVFLPYYNHDMAGNPVIDSSSSELRQSNRKENYTNWNIYSTYSFSIAEDHNFKTMVGFQAEDMGQDYLYARAYGLQVEDLPELDLVTNLNGSGNYTAPSVSGYRNSWASAGFFGRINYDYKGRYLVEGNLRYDGASRFRRGSRWQWSPSFSLGWNVAQEEFWKPISRTWNQLKLRFSYGALGNMNTSGWYPTYRNMNLAAANGNWLQNGVRPNTAYVGGLVSTALTWEKVRSLNGGLDFGLLNNRLTGSFDAFVRYTDDMVGPAPELPGTLGVSVPKTNNCDLRTVGWELTIGWRDRTEFGMDYGAKFNLSDARTFIDRYPGNPTNSLSTFVAGREIGEIWGYETVGIAKTDAEMQAHLEAVGGQDAIGSQWQAGDIMYKDLDGKPGITSGAYTVEDHGDLKVIGNNTPRYQFGLDLNASWKGFDVRLFFQGVMKRDFWRDGTIFWGVYGSEWWSNGLVGHEDFFHADAIGLPGHEIPANTDSYYPRPIFDNFKNQEVQTRYLQNAAYIRLKNLQIGYTIPSNVINKIGISNLRVFVSGENLWTGTKLSKLLDPETLNGGYVGNAYPLMKTWSFGLSVTL